MKRNSPHKNPAKDTKPPVANVNESMPAESSGRRPYPADVTSPESNAEFLRGMGDFCYERANEIERAAATQHDTRRESRKRK
jgi:hypothetical protein